MVRITASSSHAAMTPDPRGSEVQGSEDQGNVSSSIVKDVMFRVSSSVVKDPTKAQGARAIKGVNSRSALTRQLRGPGPVRLTPGTLHALQRRGAARPSRVHGGGGRLETKHSTSPKQRNGRPAGPCTLPVLGTPADQQ